MHRDHSLGVREQVDGFVHLRDVVLALGVPYAVVAVVFVVLGAGDPRVRFFLRRCFLTSDDSRGGSVHDAKIDHPGVDVREIEARHAASHAADQPRVPGRLEVSLHPVRRRGRRHHAPLHDAAVSTAAARDPRVAPRSSRGGDVRRVRAVTVRRRSGEHARVVDDANLSGVIRGEQPLAVHGSPNLVDVGAVLTLLPDAHHLETEGRRPRVPTASAVVITLVSFEQRVRIVRGVHRLFFRRGIVVLVLLFLFFFPRRLARVHAVPRGPRQQLAAGHEVIQQFVRRAPAAHAPAALGPVHVKHRG